jgi:hypothetical protein
MSDLLICPATSAGNTVLIRHGNHPEGAFINEKDGRLAYVQVQAAPTGRPDTAGIECAIASLRAVWGPLPVHDDSGACSHLAR